MITLRRKFQIYLAGLHLLAFGVAVYYNHVLGLWFFLVEVLIIASALAGFRLIHIALRPLEFVKSFRDLLNEHQFSTRFTEVGQLEMDQLIAAYNVMLKDLYEERLRLGDQRGFLERFMEVTPVGVLITDFDGRINLANPAAAKFLDTTEQELKGQGFSGLKSGLGQHLDALAPGSSELVNWQGARRLRIQKQSFPDRGFDRKFVLIEELTALLNESERLAYEKLIRLMSHEVNNTIASTNSLLESCRTYAPQLLDDDREDYINALHVVITRNEHLNQFMRSFAQVVKLPDPSRKPCDIAALLGQLETIFQAQCASLQIQWRTSLETNLPAVSVDRGQLEQALINIIKNGIEAIGSKGTLEIIAKSRGRAVCLEILDSGCGLDPETSSELFTPFYTSKSTGQGLGLTLVKEILLRHGFDFGLRTVQDGRTCFTIEMHTGM